MAEVRILEAPSVEDTPSWVDAHSCRARGVLITGSAGERRVKLLEYNWWYPTPFDVDRPLPYQMTVGTIVRLQLRSEHGPATLVRWSAHMSPPGTPRARRRMIPSLTTRHRRLTSWWAVC